MLNYHVQQEYNYDLLYSIVYLKRKVQLKPGENYGPRVAEDEEVVMKHKHTLPVLLHQYFKLRIVTITILALYTLTSTFCLREGTPGD